MHPMVHAQAKHLLAPFVFRAGWWRRPPAAQGALAIFTFHRVCERAELGWADPTVWSGSPATFAGMLAWLRRHFTPISWGMLFDAWDGRGELPPRPALITFDDGYREVYRLALPLLREARVPAAVFVTTEVLDRPDALLWNDRLSCLLVQTTRSVVAVDGLGTLPLADQPTRRLAFRRLMAWLARLTEGEKRGILEALADQLDVRIPADAALYLSSTELRAMDGQGITVGAHTCSHPILSRVDAPTAQREIAESKRRLEALLGHPVETFAYPAGRPADYTMETVGLVRAAGFRAAVTTVPGLNRRDGAFDPLQLRRLHVGQRLSDLQFSVGKALWGEEHG